MNNNLTNINQGNRFDLDLKGLGLIEVLANNTVFNN